MRFLPRLASTILSAAALAACGGGSSDPTQSEPAQPTAPTQPAQPTTPSTFCDIRTGSGRLTGVVTSVHDGDTITVANQSVRLDSIDAPELTQPYGSQARDNLSALVLNKPVTVTFGKKDKYGRVVGTVFGSDCSLVNLQQVQDGAAWYYKAYQCEIAQSERSAYEAAEEAARNAGRGLWAFEAMAPWVFRNGKEPTTPACSGDGPTWIAGTPDADDPTPLQPPTPTPPTNPGTPPVTTTPPVPSSCAPIWVNGYRRANGTLVSGYWRRPAGCA